MRARGTTGRSYGELNKIAWTSGNSGQQIHAVRLKAANAWGLYDMLGSVWQYTSDGMSSDGHD